MSYPARLPSAAGLGTTAFAIGCSTVSYVSVSVRGHEMIDGCTCDDGDTDEHTCPYAEDVNSDFETTCLCCEECEAECAASI